MMAQKRKTYTAEFKPEAVRLVTHQAYTLSEAASNSTSMPICSGNGKISFKIKDMKNLIAWLNKVSVET